MQQSLKFPLLRRSQFTIRTRKPKASTLVWYTLAVYLIGSIGQVSAAAYGESCLDSQKCQEVFNANYECSNQKCRRPPFGTELNDIIGYVVVALMVAFSNAGGMGAGSIIIPAYIFFYGFVATDSIPLSKITIFAGALMNIILVWSQRHPSNKSAFLINYGLAASVAPFMLAGTQVGVLIAKMLPPVFIWVTLISYLSYTTYKMYKRAVKFSPAEVAIAIPEELDSSDIDIKPPKSPTAKAPVVTDTSRPQTGLQKFGSLEASAASTVLELRTNSTNNFDGRGGAFEPSPLGIDGVPSTKQLLRENLFNFAMMGLALSAIFATSLLRGGKGSPSILGIPSCSVLSFLLLICCQAVCVLISYCAHKHNKQAKERHEGKVTAISAENKKKIIILSYLTGIASGSIGVGGGSILNPYMLELGVDPLTASALSGFCILFSSSSTTAQFMIAGAIQLDHGLILMCLSAVGAIIGNSIIKRFIVARGKSHHIVWIVFLILALSMGVLPIQMWMELQNFQTFFKWGSIC